MQQSTIFFLCALLIFLGQACRVHAQSRGTLAVTAVVETSVALVEVQDGRWILIAANDADPVSTFAPHLSAIEHSDGLARTHGLSEGQGTFTRLRRRSIEPTQALTGTGAWSLPNETKAIPDVARRCVLSQSCLECRITLSCSPPGSRPPCTYFPVRCLEFATHASAEPLRE
jgi:hypothetical protein